MPRTLVGISLLLALLPASVVLAQMPAQVVVAPVERRPIELTQPLVASVMPVTQTVVAAEQEGIVEERMFDEGQRVEKGAVLARVNTDLLEKQRDAAVAARDTAKAQLQAAQAEYENAQREATRLTDLFEQRVAPEKEYRDALTRRDFYAATVATRTAQVAEKNAEAERLQTMLNKAQTYSPLEGVIARRHIEVGEWIEKGAAIADLLQLDPLFVEVDVPEAVIARVQKGDTARVRIDALGQKDFQGTIDQILPQADAASRTFRVKILLPNPEFAIWPGFFARATLVSDSSGQMLLVPRDALVTNQGQTHVVAARDGNAVVVPVQVGPPQGDLIAVTGELSEGELVVIRGNESLRGGETLIVMNPPAAPGTPATQPTAAAGAGSDGMNGNSH